MSTPVGLHDSNCLMVGSPSSITMCSPHNQRSERRAVVQAPDTAIILPTLCSAQQCVLDGISHIVRRRKDRGIHPVAPQVGCSFIRQQQACASVYGRLLHRRQCLTAVLCFAGVCRPPPAGLCCSGHLQPSEANTDGHVILREHCLGSLLMPV